MQRETLEGQLSQVIYVKSGHPKNNPKHARQPWSNQATTLGNPSRKTGTSSRNFAQSQHQNWSNPADLAPDLLEPNRN